MRSYDPKTIEPKWQKAWEEKKLYRTKRDDKKPKYYCLVEFPYPSGDGLHTGHVKSYTAMDIVSRKRRSEGFNVLYPIGWDAFGLPTENFAIKTGTHPKIVTKENTDTFRRQLKSIGISFDWSREINTTDPSYYKWTQWIFLQFFKKGLAYKAKIPINWCLSCKIGLANEEVIEGRCERCGGDTEKQDKEQWMLAITKYADKLEKNLADLDYLPQIKTQQINWIGRSEGVYIDFQVAGEDIKIPIFTTRPDTIFGATYMVLAPEHDLVNSLRNKISNWDEVEKYKKDIQKKTEIERTAEEKEKSGICLDGISAINPVNGREIPIFIADYVLATYGTGAVMAVPAHDTRDYLFAKKYNLPSIKVILPTKDDSDASAECWTQEGVMSSSGEFDGIQSEEAAEKIILWIEKNGWGKRSIQYKLHDWVFSRQRYWGEPIPIINCEKCGMVAVPEKDLPVELPDIKEYEPTNTGESPLAKVSEWVNVTCPKCASPAHRETDVMPNWAGSSWYFLRYIDPDNEDVFALQDKLKHWMPVDWYNGGMEHTTLHLLYSRFWNLFLHDEGHVPAGEPYKKRTAHGMILAEGGVKMSKSKGNVVNPDEIIEQFGADTLRVYEMFMGPFDQAIAWNPNDIVGSRKFLEKVWEYINKWSDNQKKDGDTPQEINTLLNETIMKVGSDIEKMSFNTAISQMMIFINSIRKLNDETGTFISKKEIEQFLSILAPFAPHITEELWNIIGNIDSIHLVAWPNVDEDALQKRSVTIAIQVNGKVRDTIDIDINSSEKDIKALVLGMDTIKKWTEGKTINKFIYIENKIINIVV